MCCLTAATLLSIVSKHEIHFHHQEVAIIKKFNINLQNSEISCTQESGSNGFHQNTVSDDSDTSIGDAEREVEKAQRVYMDFNGKDFDTDSLHNKKDSAANN